MNRFLAETLNFLNVIIALLAVAGGILAGMRLITFAGPIVGLGIGAIVGVVFAALICGMIAYVALIERHLAQIAANSRSSGSQAQPLTNSGRHEPKF